MLNKSGISKTTYGAPKQILANVELQASVGVIVDDALGTEVGTKKIAKAGTPVAVDFSNRSLPVAASRQAVSESATATVTGTGVTAASVTAGDANGTALYFGIVNYNRLDSDVQALVSCGVNVVGAVSIIKG